MEKDAVHTATDERAPFVPGDGPRQKFQNSRFAAFYRRHKILVIAVGVMICLLPLLGLLALRNRGARAHSLEDAVSPIVYPSPQGYGAGNWSESYSKAHAMVTNMTLEEMNNVTLGLNTVTGCVGFSGSVSRLGYPGMCMQDAGNGVRGTDGVNAYASGLHIGASWNASLAYDRALYMGAEFRKKGVSVALGPVVGPIGRVATNGRNWEGFAADPYLDGILGAQSVIGLQENVIASAKHFLAYEQETNRNPYTNDNGGVVESTSANVDDQTMHELYLWPFQDLVEAGAGCVMCSYNRINNTYSCANSKTLNGLLKGELNFQGFVVSDWVAQHSGLETANAGLDMAMPNSPFWSDGFLANAVRNNSLNETRLVDMATRIVATWYQFGLNEMNATAVGAGLPGNPLAPHTYVDAKDPASRPSLLEQAIQGHVLVKNANNTLPLKSPRILSIFGADATVQVSLDPGNNDFEVGRQGINFTQTDLNDINDGLAYNDYPQTKAGTLFVGGGSGTNVPAYISSPYDALKAQAYQDDTTLFHDFSSMSPNVVSISSACLVFINAYASEQWDRSALADSASDDLVNNVASQCPKTIVVVHNAGIRLVDAWIENPNVTAVIFAHLPGQDTGRSLVQLLYGQASPSGRLPYTVAKQASDYVSLGGPCTVGDSDLDPQCDFTEGVNIDYRSFLARNVTPRFDFGFGLTYTTFNYSMLSTSNLNITATPLTTKSTAPVYTNGTTTQNANNTLVGPAGLTSLFDSIGAISATITNTGNVSGSEVAQLYLQLPAANNNASNPTTRMLRGFQKLLLEPGNSSSVDFPLRRKDVSYWNTTRQQWVVPSGKFGVWVGRSVLDADALVGSFEL